jgi:hypothetical protein
VWRQLDKLCDKSPLVAPVRLQQLREEKQQLSREVAQLRARVAELEQR